MMDEHLSIKHFIFIFILENSDLSDITSVINFDKYDFSVLCLS